MKTKKTISVVLAMIMLLSCSPALFGAVFAAGSTITYNTSGEFELDNLMSGNTYVIPNKVTMTIPEGFGLHIPSNCTLKVAKGGTLDIEGDLIVTGNNAQSYGTLDVEGNIINSENMSVGAYGVAQAHVRFPSLASVGLKDCIRVWYASSASGNAYENLTPDFTYIKVNDEGADIPLPLNRYLYIKADIIKDGDEANIKYDDGLMNVFLDRVDVPYAAESHRTKLIDAGDITYSKWTNDDDFLKTYRISLTSGTGYTVYGRDGEENVAYVKYGMPFTFYVEYDENYQMSATTADVYIYNGYGVLPYNNDPTGLNNINTDTVAATPDASGYYRIPAVVNDYTVYVNMLAIPDEKVTQIGGILQTVRSIFEMIINFFRQIANVFGIGG